MQQVTGLYGVRAGDLYTSNGEDVWKIDWECQMGLPALVMINVYTGEVRGNEEECLDLSGFALLGKAH